MSAVTLSTYVHVCNNDNYLYMFIYISESHFSLGSLRFSLSVSFLSPLVSKKICLDVVLLRAENNMKNNNRKMSRSVDELNAAIQTE